MKNLLLAAAAASALMLGGCASMCPCGESGASSHPTVTIDSRTMLPTVSPDPLFFAQAQKNVTITWHLPANAGLKFAADGIVVDGELTDKPTGGDKAMAAAGGVVLQREQTEIVDCKPAGERAYSCVNRHTRPGRYKYSVHVLQNGKPLAADPQIMND